MITEKGPDISFPVSTEFLAILHLAIDPVVKVLFIDNSNDEENDRREAVAKRRTKLRKEKAKFLARYWETLKNKIKK